MTSQTDEAILKFESRVKVLGWTLFPNSNFIDLCFYDCIDERKKKGTNSIGFFVLNTLWRTNKKVLTTKDERYDVHKHAFHADAMCCSAHTTCYLVLLVFFSLCVIFFFFSSQTCYSRQIRKMRAHIIFKVRVIKLLHKSDHYEIPTRDCLTRVRVCVAHPTIILRSRSFASKPKSLTVPAAHTRYFLCFAAISYQRSDIKMLYDYFCTMTDQVSN